MFGVGMQELLIVGVVALLVVGPKRLPEVAKMLGKGYAQVKKATDDLQDSIKVELEAKRNEELKQKFPHLAVEEPKPGEGPAPDSPPAGVQAPPPAEEEVPTHFGEGGDSGYGLTVSHPMPTSPPPKDPKDG